MIYFPDLVVYQFSFIMIIDGTYTDDLNTNVNFTEEVKTLVQYEYMLSLIRKFYIVLSVIEVKGVDV